MQRFSAELPLGTRGTTSMHGLRESSSYFFFAAQLVSLAILWFLFTGTLSWSEALVGVGGVLLAMVGTLRVRVAKLAYFNSRPRWFAEALNIPKQVLIDSVAVTRVLWRRAAFGED